MTLEKVNAFLDHLILGTDKGLYKWKRSDRELATKLTISRPVPGFSFCLEVNEGVIYIRRDDATPPNYELFVKYENGLPTSRISYESAEFVARVVRLFNLAYSSHKNLDTFIDSIIKA